MPETGPDRDSRTPWDGGNPGGTGCDGTVCAGACFVACASGCALSLGVALAASALVGSGTGAITSIVQNN